MAGPTSPNTSVEDALKSFLISKGTNGASSMQITEYLKFVSNSQEIAILLDQLRDDRKVDKYVIKQGRGRPSTWWRATTRMLEDD